MSRRASTDPVAARALGPPATRVAALAFAVALVAALPAVALDPALAITQYVRTGWRAPLALPHDNITAVTQTRDGYLWVGTVDGLARFDGVRSTVYDRSNTPALGNNWIRALLEDRDGRLWVASLGGGLACRVRGEFVRMGPDRGLASDSVGALLEDRSGRLWAGSLGEGLFRFDGERFARVPGTESLDHATVRALAEDADGVVWIGTELGAFAYDGTTTTPAPAALGFDGDVVPALARDADALWFASASRGVRRLRGGKVDVVIPASALAHPRVWTLAVDSDHSLWIGTDGGGLHRWTDGQLSGFRRGDGLPSDFVWAIHEDDEKGLWVGTNGGGLIRLKAGSVTTITSREGLPSDFTWSVLRSRDGALWVGTENGGAARMAGGAIERFGRERGLAGSARALFQGADGRIWAGGDAGVHVLEAGRFRHVDFPGREDNIAQAFAETPDGVLWIGWNTGGVDAWRGRPAERLTDAQGLAGNSINTLRVGSAGELWIGTVNGLTRRDPDGTTSTIDHEDGLPSDYVTALFERPPGVLWIATRGGIARLREGRVESATTADGLFDDAIMAALPGDDRNLWLGGNRGLFSAPLPGLEGALRFGAHGIASRALGLEDGLQSLEINQSGSSALKDDDGRLWFATRVGVASVDPQRIRSGDRPPRVVIEQATADGRVLPDHGGWELPSSTRRIDFRFTALSFESIHGLRIESRLEGFDPEWTPAGTDRYAAYTALPHGTYRFRVIATSGDGVANEIGDSVSFTIRPRLTERTGFRVAAAAVLLLAGPLFYRFRVRMLSRQKSELERLVETRTAEVARANERLEQLAREDALTGVANRRSFDEALDAEWRRAARQRLPLALLMIDVDRFKTFNDRAGHPRGDEALRKIAGALAAACRRAGDTVARYGGEEFAALLPGSSRGEALLTAEKIRRAVEALAIPHPEPEGGAVVTVSVGVAAHVPTNDRAGLELLDAADGALYRAKELGRNRVELAEITAATPD